MMHGQKNIKFIFQYARYEHSSNKSNNELFYGVEGVFLNYQLPN